MHCQVQGDLRKRLHEYVFMYTNNTVYCLIAADSVCVVYALSPERMSAGSYAWQLHTRRQSFRSGISSLMG